MGVPTQADVGPVYDLILATRDGATLPCKNKDGQVVNLSQVAFVTSVSQQNQQHEETELQHKDNLVQLGSSNLIDREFDQWPQITQGDWSGGALQRVLTGGTPLTSFGPQSDPTRYWDGLGILWPTSDYLPQQAVNATADQAEAGGQMIAAGPHGTVSGFLVNGGSLVLAFVYEYMQQAAPQNNKIIIQGNVGSSVTITNPPGTVAGTPDTCDLMIAFGYLWRAYTTGGNTVNLDYYDGAGTRTAGTTIGNATTLGFRAGNSTQPPVSMTASVVGNKRLLAIAYVDITANQSFVRIYDVTNGAFNSFTLLPLPQPVPPITSTSGMVQRMEFVGDSLIMAIGEGTDVSLVNYNIVSATFSTLARFPNINVAGSVAEGGVYFCSVAGSMFIITLDNSRVAAGVGAAANMYLLQGSSLQDVGPLQVQSPNAAGNFLMLVSDPSAFGPYAVFAVAYRPPSTANSRVTVMAYDVLRGRLFRLADVGLYDTILGLSMGRRLAILPGLSHPFGAGSINAQWAVAPATLSWNGSASDKTNVQRLMMGVSSGSWTQFLQQGVQITSSIIDFTSAAPKLFRQLVLKVLNPGLPLDTAITVQLDAWLDQDPTSLAAVPDFSTGAIATGVNGGVLGQTQFKLLINKIATKIVYRMTTVGPSTTPTAAVKAVSVVVQAATGWTRTMFLDLADNVLTNAKQANETCWSRQQPVGQPVLDATAAYNFTRLLWRLKGGEVTATFPNGDPPADWLMQDIHWDSPKPFGSSFRADQRSSLGYICQFKMREDI